MRSPLIASIPVARPIAVPALHLFLVLAALFQLAFDLAAAVVILLLEGATFAAGALIAVIAALIAAAPAALAALILVRIGRGAARPTDEDQAQGGRPSKNLHRQLLHARPERTDE